MTPWHLFLVEDGDRHRLMSGQSESVCKAEELVRVAAAEEHCMNPLELSATYLGIAHNGDIDIPIGPQH